jgi:hypothetical protein
MYSREEKKIFVSMHARSEDNIEVDIQELGWGGGGLGWID